MVQHEATSWLDYIKDYCALSEWYRDVTNKGINGIKIPELSRI